MGREYVGAAVRAVLDRPWMNESNTQRTAATLDDIGEEGAGIVERRSKTRGEGWRRVVERY